MYLNPAAAVADDVAIGAMILFLQILLLLLLRLLMLLLRLVSMKRLPAMWISLEGAVLCC